MHLEDRPAEGHGGVISARFISTCGGSGQAERFDMAGDLTGPQA
ncbi:hypothetical protein [Micromonospora parva]